MKKEEALVRRSEEEVLKNMDPASHFKPAETIEFRNGTDSVGARGLQMATVRRRCSR
ncbi:MAG: hypothetical protein ACKOEQ_13565 [Verrucomicrobiota bacterium]